LKKISKELSLNIASTYAAKDTVSEVNMAIALEERLPTDRLMIGV